MRKALTVFLAALLALVILVPSPAPGQKGPIKIGMIVPQSGPLAANGKDMINGYEMFFEEQKYRLAGREVKFIVEDDEGKPATGLTKIRGLVEGQGVHLVTGPLSAGVGYAVAPYIDGKKIPALFPIVAGDDLTQRKRSPYIVRVGWAGSQPSHPFGKWVHDTLKYKRIAVIAYDFAFGWEVVAGFQRTFEEAGGQVVQKLWPPLGNADFAPYVSQLRRDVDTPGSTRDFGGDIIPYIVKHGKAVAHRFTDSCIRAAEEIEEYWRERGYEVEVKLVDAGFVAAMRSARTDVRSNMVNGLPTRRKDHDPRASRPKAMEVA